jgi:Immunity protein 50
MNLVEGSDKVERIFGLWPDFHDAEVLSITLDRAPADSGPTVRIAVHAFEMAKEVDASGHYVLRNHVVVTFALHGAEVVRLQGFNHQNVLSDLSFSKPAEPVAEGMAVEVELEPSYGVAAIFQCARAEVVSVEPFDPARSGPS